MQISRFFVLVLFFALGQQAHAQSTAPASKLEVRVGQLENRLSTIEQNLSRLEKLLDNRAMLELFQRVDELADELSQLRGELEQQGHDAAGLKKRQRELYLDTDRRLRELESGSGQSAGQAAAPIILPEPAPTAPQLPAVEQPGAAAETAPSVGGAPSVSIPRKGVSQAVQKLLDSKKPEAPNPLPPATEPAATDPKPATETPVRKAAPKATVSEERAQYQKAFDMLKEGRYKQARAAFKTFIEKYPEGRYSGNAQYWLGEANYVTRQFEQGVEEFKKVLSNYPGSNKVPDAMLKLGYTYYELRRTEQSRLILEELRKRFPKSTAARLAGKRLERMKNEGL